jgi:hypothetical protein
VEGEEQNGDRKKVSFQSVGCNSLWCFFVQKWSLLLKDANQEGTAKVIDKIKSGWAALD